MLQAVLDAKHHDALTNQFRKVFDYTFQVAKKVRTETEIGKRRFGCICRGAISQTDILISSVPTLVGAGETIELVAKHLHDQGAQHISVAIVPYPRHKALHAW